MATISQLNINGSLYDVNDKRISTLSDYVIEQGTSGNFTYRKWNSGVCEAWGIIPVTISITSPEGSMYYGPYTLSIPSGIFNAIPIINTLCSVQGGYAMYWMSGPNLSATGGPGWFFSDVSKSNHSVSLHVQAIGTWK